MSSNSLADGPYDPSLPFILGLPKHCTHLLFHYTLVRTIPKVCSHGSLSTIDARLTQHDTCCVVCSGHFCKSHLLLPLRCDGGHQRHQCAWLWRGVHPLQRGSCQALPFRSQARSNQLVEALPQVRVGEARGLAGYRFQQWLCHREAQGADCGHTDVECEHSSARGSTAGGCCCCWSS